MAYVVQLVNVMGMSSKLHFFDCEISSVIQNNVIRNTMTVGKVFYDAAYGGTSGALEVEKLL